jgi:hypothetical protein
LSRLRELLGKWRRPGPQRSDAAGAAETDQLILSDEPITAAAQDLLGRGALVDGICAAIVAWPASQPLVVAVTGSWGEGKTSVIKLVLQRLRDSGRHVIIEFDPWFFNSPEALIQGFLTSIEQALMELPEFRRTRAARKAWRATRGTLSSLPRINVLGSGIDFSNLRREAPPIDEIRTHVANMCGSLGRRVVVVLDDVDRLTAEDVRITLKLVKLWNSFSGFVFLLAFDRAAVEGKLEQELKSDPLLLEKLVQVEIRLPAPNARAIGRLIDAHFEKLEDVHGITYEHDFVERFGTMWRSGISRSVTTLRAAKRYLNVVTFAVPFVGGEVNYADLFALEFLRLFYPSIYEGAKRHQDLFAGVSMSGLGGDQEHQRRKSYHEALLQQLATDDDRDIVKAVLSTVFPLFEESVLPMGGRYGQSHLAGWTREQRAAAPDRLPIYFQYGVPEGEVPDTWVRVLMGQVNAANEADVPNIVAAAFSEAKEKGTLGKVLDRLIHFAEEVSRERAAPLIWAVIEQEGLYETRAEAFERSEFAAARALLFALAARFQHSPNIQHVLADVVRRGPLSFASDIVHFAVPRLNDLVRDWTHVDGDALRCELRNRVKGEYVDKGRNLLTEQPDWVSSRVLYEIGDRKMASEYLIGLFRVDPSLVPPFLARFVSRPFDEPQFHLADMAKWLDIDSLREAVRSLPVPAPSTEDERFAVQQFLRSDLTGQDE